MDAGLDRALAEKHINAYDGELSSKQKSADSDFGPDDAILSEFTKEEESKIMHRIDRRLVFTVGLAYCVSLMDRTNLSAANIAGMSKALGLEIGERYSIITLVFFCTYIVFQFPSTILIKKIGPRVFLSTIVFSWGVIMIGMGFIKNWQSMAALRVVLGILEAGFFPGSVYLLSTWYVRYEVQKRYSVFYIIGSLASAVSGIMAFGIMQMAGLQGLGGWSWIFIIEGVLSCLVGVYTYIFIVDFPDSNRRNWGFLTARETQFVLARVNADRSDAVTEKWALKKFLGPALDWKIWGFAMIFGMTTTVSYALAYFLPIILNRGLGYSVGVTQCLTAPPYAAAGILMYASGYVGDRWRIRGPLIAFNAVLCLIGLPVMGWAKSSSVRYFAVFLTTMGANANIPAVLTYQANNIRGHWKRAFCSATLVGFGGIGGIIGSLVFRSQDAPAYHPGLYACIASQLIVILIVGVLSVYFHFQNKKQERGEKVIEGADGFRYTI
ncbi:MFS general substrate transporter [Microthyrium microscopicum]|uniref:MFS general substrate transporter n=1 Tax=Microthyrium microscopicum TaxID=703497 RepID=A0A6A6UTB3_9PEZI|nr:MFS general substrate transporter [Microthyrium microscopicum]